MPAATRKSQIQPNGASDTISSTKLQQQQQNNNDPEYEDNSDIESESESQIYKKEDAQEVYLLIQTNLDNSSELIQILKQNTELSKQTIYLLSQSESLSLFKTVAISISADNSSSNASLTLGPWLKSILLAKGSLLATDQESVELLKMLQSTLNQNIKLLPDILSLQGRLALLQSQLKLRKEMIGSNGQTAIGAATGLVEEKSGKAAEVSMVMDGENNDSEFDDDGEDEEDDDEDEDEDEEADEADGSA
ncbi:unnamed protein product [Ambrosiozyma monospora]|uniref:Unnamed protein product n=1 Tax=Ambrosiozyma monospora TaxID=43982 RepID=A0ACB5TY26_AMBMO|nr:unnamed protein product [Ambrosiozyma monospora]